MSIAVLVQVYDEVRRLAIAGSAVAPGDFRLKKLIAPLEKSGEKAPVFARVAQAATALVESNDKSASAALLELNGLVSAILYTQGETGIAGNFNPLESIDLGGQATQASARVLKPLLEALSSTGSGRLELIRDAFERGTFKDLRLVKAALGALDDSYSEISQFVAENVLPLYGKAILPELRAAIDIKGRAGHVHRLELMHRLDPQGSRDLVQSALNDGSKEMRVAAVECLGKADEDLAFLLEQAGAKAKDVRAAALRALAGAGVGRTDIIAVLKKAVNGADLELLMPRIKECTLPEIQDSVLAQAELQAKELLSSKDKKEQAAAVVRLQRLISCLEDRTDEGAVAFLLSCFEKATAFSAIKSEPSGSDVNEQIAHVLSRGTPRMQQQLLAARDSLSGGMLAPALFAARSILSPDEFFKEFSPLLRELAKKPGKKASLEQERGNALLLALVAADDRYHYRGWMHRAAFERVERSTTLKELDPRWLDEAVQAGSVELVCKLARQGHEKAERFLSEQLATLKEPHERSQVLRAMVRIGHPDAADALIGILKEQAKSTSYFYYSYWYGSMIAELPKSALPKFEELLPSLPEKMIDQLMDSVVALKNKPE